MIKQLLTVTIIVITIFTISFRVNEELQYVALKTLDGIKLFFLDLKSDYTNFLTTHFNQSAEIERLMKEEQDYQNLKLKYIALKNSFENLVKEHNLSHQEPSMRFVKTISYQEFGNIYKIWIDYRGFDKSKIYGLLKDGYAVGIGIEQNGRMLAILNGDEKCSYSVHIGTSKAPGIIRGNSSKNEVYVDYIPVWLEINIGDEVVTNGLDDIFFEGIKVGQVTKIEQSQGYKKATIKTYNDILHPSYFILIENTK